MRLGQLEKGTSYPSCRAKDILSYKIPVLPISKQKQIVQTLDSADSLRQKRKEQINLLDDYLKSVYFEMFGDPIQNDKSWKTYKFYDICPTRLGKMLDAKKQTGRNPKQYLRNQNVLWGKFNLNELAIMDFDLREQKEFRLIKGDVLICEGGEVGRTAIWNEEIIECYFQKALHRGRPNIKRILPIYILHLMWMYSKYGGFKDYVSSVTIAHLTGEKLKSMIIPVPPIELQNKFASIVEQVEQTKQKMCASLDEMDNHFNALMKRYFR
jgi:type I restriction enzyme S subunit